MERKVLITEDKKKIEIEKMIDNIFLFLQKNIYDKKWGLLDGFSSVILFQAYLYNYSKDDNILDDLYDKIDFLFLHLDKIRIPTVCGGYAGICWLLRYLYREKIVASDDIDDSLENLDLYIIKLFYKYYINDTDYLHGGLGIASYFLFSGTNYGRDICKVYLDKLDEKKIIQDDGSCMWTTRVNNSGRTETVVNLSLSHGMASIIIFLAKYYEKTTDSKARKLLQQTIEFYKRNTNPQSFYSVYSNWINVNSPDLLSESRLAWCYGDLGIAKALNYAGSLLEDMSIFDYSIEILDKTTQRFLDSQIEDATFCHGSSGVCYIYNHFYQITGKDKYKSSAIFWLDDTLNRIKSLNFEADYLLKNELNDVCSILTGLSGVGLTLLSSIGNRKDNWSEMLLF